MEKKIIKGRVVKVNISKTKGTVKTSVPEVKVLKEFGIESDAHAGFKHRQISLLAIESINKMNDDKEKFKPGDFAENITTEGISLNVLPLGTKIKIGNDVILEVTQIGKECHTRCDIFNKVGTCIMPTEGIFTRVISGGDIKENDPINIEL
ncbi:MOSC domain-containing protein [Candidatus Desantisbacteria bacterium]|nr:MOSC domain-containing protein [Candidatus Desantisbacteria bacterium]